MIGRGVLRNPGLLGQIHGKNLPDLEVWNDFAAELEETFIRISVNERKSVV